MPKTDVTPAPYIPFKTFLTAVEVLEQGLPDDIDKSVWPTFSYTIQTHTVSAFKFLQLIDDEGHVQDALRTLVDQKDDRKTLVGVIVRKHYPTLVDLGTKNASTQQLNDAMRQLVSNALLVKCVRFFLQAAEYAEIPVSPLWKTGKKTTGNSRKATQKKHRSRKQQPPKDTGTDEPEGQAITITLPKSGATVTLKASVDVMKLVGDERAFLFDLIDKMHSLGGDAPGGGDA